MEIMAHFYMGFGDRTKIMFLKFYLYFNENNFNILYLGFIN